MKFDNDEKKEMQKVVNVVGIFILAFFIVAGLLRGLPKWWKGKQEADQSFAVMNEAADHYLKTGDTAPFQGNTGNWNDHWNGDLIVLSYQGDEKDHKFVEVWSKGPDREWGSDDDLRVAKKQHLPVTGWWAKMWTDIKPVLVSQGNSRFDIPRYKPLAPVAVIAEEPKPVEKHVEKEEPKKSEEQGPRSPIGAEVSTGSEIVQEEKPEPPKKKGWFGLW